MTVNARYAGGLVAYGYTMKEIKIQDCAVYCTDITGPTAGGLIALSGVATLNISNCTIEDCTVDSSTRAGGLAGYFNYTNCTANLFNILIKNTSVTKDKVAANVTTIGRLFGERSSSYQVTLFAAGISVFAKDSTILLPENDSASAYTGYIAYADYLAKQENTMRVPNDLEMTRFMETMNFYNFRYCKFFLALVEEHLTKCRPDLTDKHLQIEHIMPQKLNEEWIEALGEDFDRIHQEYVGQIGNLTLIRHNQELGNSAFNKKKEVYENNAGLQIAKTNITNRTQWDKRSIQNRSKWIISTIVEKVIPIPEDMRKTNNFIPKSNRHLSFGELQMKDSIITFTEDPSIEATVVSEKCVEFEGKIWQLSDLTKELLTRKGIKFKSIQYSGAAYWEFDGIRLIDII